MNLIESLIMGKKIYQSDKYMNVVDVGNWDTTIILLPEYGTIAPGLDFTPLIDELSKSFRVVAVEPFGYGDSSITNHPRTVENIVKEIHKTIETLDIEKYIVVTHSISGLYSIKYCNSYPNEVIRFVGLDSSVPNQPNYQNVGAFYEMRSIARILGLYRGAVTINPSISLPNSGEDGRYTKKYYSKCIIEPMGLWKFSSNKWS